MPLTSARPLPLLDRPARQCDRRQRDYTLTGANGDTVILAMVFQATSIPGGVTFEGTYIVSGGTGRFAGAAGSGTLEGSAVFFDESTGAGFFSVVGMISSPGSLK